MSAQGRQLVCSNFSASQVDHRSGKKLQDRVTAQPDTAIAGPRL
jgi:hypothetical protein